jgi:polysaccharide export outer membrane protein
MKRVFFSLIAFMLLATASAAQEYLIKPGDTLAIEVVEDNSLSRSTLVLPDGNISFPFAGTVRAGGRSVAQVQSALTSALAPNFAAAPTVFVSLASVLPPPAASEVETDTITVYVFGEVNSPGPKALEPGTTLLQAMSATGGFTAFAAQKRVQLRRGASSGQEQVYKFNFRAIGNGATFNGNTTLRDGDVILVPERGLFE